MAFVIFAGQSNMGGWAQDASTLPASWKPDPLTRIWNATSHAWEVLQPGVNAGYGAFTQSWGPEVQFAIDFRADHPGEPLYLIKVVAGGTQLALDPAAGHGDWSPDSRGELFDETTQIVDEARAALDYLRPTAVFWGQGEEDANHPDAASSYGDNLAHFFAAIRASWLHDPNGRIGYFRIGTSPVYADQVRAGELKVDQADPYADSFDAAGFPHQSDNLHYTNVGLDQVGDSFYRLYQAWPPGDEGPGLSGDDTLGAPVSGGSIHGGPGADVFTFTNEPWAPVHITDFHPGEDRIDMSSLLSAAGYSGGDPVSAGYVRLQPDGAGGVEVLFDRDGPSGPAGWNYVADLSATPASVTWRELTVADAVTISEARVLRVAPEDSTAAADLAARHASGEIDDAAALQAVVRLAQATTSVATLAYQFFTGATPSAAGMDYLVSPEGPNPNNLNSAYYQAFGLENRYINFASNLGRAGQGSAQFSSDYASLTPEQAMTKAYQTIFGGTPSADKVNHLLHDLVPNGVGGSYERLQYFEAYGGDGPNGIGAKAAMVGWLLAEAVKADLGTYALSNDAFLTDVALHNAPFGVDIIGHYAQAGFAFNGG